MLHPQGNRVEYRTVELYGNRLVSTYNESDILKRVNEYPFVRIDCLVMLIELV